MMRIKKVKWCVDNEPSVMETDWDEADEMNWKSIPQMIYVNMNC